MTVNEYQKRACSFATNGGKTFAYAILGLIEECGELCEKVSVASGDSELAKEVVSTKNDFVKLSKNAGILAKRIRKEWDAFSEHEKNCINAGGALIGVDKEIGDVEWMLANISEYLHFNLEDLLEQNISKLEDRRNRNVIIGEGDNR